jgi:hypothetical protein
MSWNFFYQFNAWLYLSRIQNSIVSANLTELLNGPTAIEAETLRSHLVGGKVTLRFG